MRVHNYLASLALAFSTLTAAAYTEVNSYGTDVISDLALIYSGSDRRPQWNADNLMPYVVHTYADGTKDWFFDGFLVLEFSSGSTDIGFQNGVNEKKYATRADWEWLLEKHIATAASLDSAVARGKATLGMPRLRHKIVLGMPAPIKAQGTAWGELDGRQLDFGKTDDRIAASKWYVTEIRRRFAAREFANIDLSGIYWLEESLFTNDEVVPVITDWIYRNTMRSYWIPYYENNEEFRFNWRDKYGFDVAYQQPNYFFDRSVPLSRLEDACDESKRYGLGLEMEFETQGNSRVQHSDPDSYYSRLVDYLDTFEKKGVFDSAAVAWYSGTQGFPHLTQSTDAKDHEIADRMARIVAKRQAAKAASLTFPTNTIRDLGLIYQGNTRRIDWTEEQFVPYVAHTFADGSRDWLFDGYLFLDNMETCNKATWEWYIDRVYESGKSLDALDKCIGKLKKEIGDPGFKHKVVLTLQIPDSRAKEWGELDGRMLDFSNDADKLTAAKWYLDRMISRFRAAGYENLELHGIYWFGEDNIAAKDFPALIAPYIHAEGLEFSWIPYFKGRGYEKWRELGFDIAYHQPNHFFDPLPDKRLDEAIDISLHHGLAMEFECDHFALSQHPDSKIDRMHAYIDAFERYGVWQTSAIAYYTGSKALLEMFENPSPENQAVADRLARKIVERRANPALNHKK
ncbi:MAG: DUF4855 domain-containing protein [Muribaculaceae bacterium]|nr:DUF4855 domain-containing protein [Muribaculaceae bacterium]